MRRRATPRGPRGAHARGRGRLIPSRCRAPPTTPLGRRRRRSARTHWWCESKSLIRYSLVFGLAMGRSRNRPGNWVDAVRSENREQPALEPEGDTAAPGRRAVGERDSECLSEEQLVVVERRDGERLAVVETELELVLEPLDALEGRLAARGRRKERIACRNELAFETERVLERAHSPDRAIQEILHVALGADANDLAHRERPPALERGEAVAFMPPTRTLRRHHDWRSNGGVRERGVGVVANRRR